MAENKPAEYLEQQKCSECGTKLPIIRDLTSCSEIKDEWKVRKNYGLGLYYIFLGGEYYRPVGHFAHICKKCFDEPLPYHERKELLPEYELRKEQFKCNNY